MASPADSIRDLMQVLAGMPISAKARHVKDDIAELRRVFQNDEAFSIALGAITNRLRKLRVEDGGELVHDLEGWWRVKFASGLVDRADLRIIFRPDESGIELRAFGHRHEPESIYFRAAARR